MFGELPILWITWFKGSKKMDKFIPNSNYVAIKTLWKIISKDFVPNIRTEILVSFHKVWPQNKLKGSMSTCMEIVTEMKNALEWKTCLTSMFSETFSPHEHALAALWQHYLENKISTCLAFISQQAYAAIFEIFKKMRSFPEPPNSISRSSIISCF